jgi:hypothetical protein
MSVEDVIFNLVLKVEENYSEIRKYETALFRVLSLMRRAGLPENARDAIALVQQLIMSARLLQTAITALNLAMATSPAGVVLATVGLITAGASGAEAIDMFLRRGE